MIKEIKQLNDTFYKIFDDLKEAKPSLAGCDEAFVSISKKILEQYELEYRLLDLKCRVETEREINRLQARYDRLVPQRWITRFFHRKKQNYAATLIDIEANEAADEFFANCEKRLAEQAAKRLETEQAQAEIDEEFEIVDDALEDTAELTQDEPQGESGNVTAGEPTAVQEQAQILSGDEPYSAESDPRNATSSSSPPCGEMSSNFPDMKSPRTDKAKAKKSNKGGGKNVREGDQAG